MKTYEECIPCLLRQAHQIADLATSDETLKNEIIDDLVSLIPGLSFESSPPETARLIQKKIKKKVLGRDIYKDIKAKSNQMALKLYPQMKEMIEHSKEKLLTAVEMAIAGNVIDYGAKNTLNIEQEIDQLFKGQFQKHAKVVFDFGQFKQALNETNEILYLADNAGEIVFDKILIEELVSQGKKVILAVRGEPVINDALMEDALSCGLDQVAQVISSGVDAPGTILKYCCEEFLTIYRKSQLIISKGQGNYEALSEEKEPIYFLLRAKCPVIADHLKVEVGDIVLKEAKR